MSPRSSSALLLPVLALAAAAQDVDWAAKVKNAVENPRYALRRAVSDDIARAGDAAVPAIEAYAAAHGRARIPLLLVDALARVGQGGEPTRALLRGWADDPAFYWRAQALTGLANRGSGEDAGRFRAALRDPSHLFRVAGARGLYALAKAAGDPWEEGCEVLADPDPRARVLLALALWESREGAALPVLVAALADDRAFLDDAWGRRYALQVHQALRRVAGTDFGYRAEAPLAANAEAIAKAAAWAEVPAPEAKENDATVDAGGLEIRSCRHGDLFVRWSGDRIDLGLDREIRAALPADALATLLGELDTVLTTPDEPRRTVGEVVCDYLQITVRKPERLWRLAPGALPEGLARWCQRLAATLVEHGHAAAAAAVQARLPQFAPGG